MSDQDSSVEQAANVVGAVARMAAPTATVVTAANIVQDARWKASGPHIVAPYPNPYFVRPRLVPYLGDAGDESDPAPPYQEGEE